MDTTYKWVLGFHIIAIIAWMAGIMMLPRLFIYQMQAEPGSKMELVLKDAQRRLQRIVMNPAMILALVLGCTLIWINATFRGWGFLLTPWMLTKLAGVVFMLSWHAFLARARRQFEAGTNTRSERFWRMTNELPFLVAIVMVLAVTTKFGG